MPFEFQFKPTKQFGGLVYKDVDLEETVRWAYFEGRLTRRQSSTEERGVHDVGGDVQVSFLFYLFILCIRNKKIKKN